MDTNNKQYFRGAALSRREFTRACVLGTLALTTHSLLEAGAENLAPAPTGPPYEIIPLDNGWLFGGKFTANAGADESALFSKITLPHCVAKLSWQKWDPASWQNVWLYRRHITLSKAQLSKRIFLGFDGVMTGAKPVFNGVSLPEHLGGYLPFMREVTQWAKEGDNILELEVDGRWQSVPPDGNPKGAKSVDYLQPAGITRSVELDILPHVFIKNVFAKPVNVLDPGRSVEVTCKLDAASFTAKPHEIKVELKDGSRVIATAQKTVTDIDEGETEVALTLTNLGDIALWELDAPRLYEVVTTLSGGGAELFTHDIEIGFREGRFTTEGFFLNGKRVQLFGLDRHEIYPYVGAAMPHRVTRRDAEILKHEFNCNIVRCSHYPQSEEFLAACDRLGLMVWQETPGWGYLGDEAWKELVVRDVKEMIIRDRNHPSIVIWGVRVNESRNDQPLYRRTTELARSLDGTRPCSGSMTSGSRKGWEKEWHEDVFAFDDYQSEPDGSVKLDKATPGVPYMLAEAVGQFSYEAKKGFNNKYRRAGELSLQVNQGLYHAQAHNKAAADPGNSGVIAWCAFDYASLMNAYDGVKCPGVADSFRIPKLAASFYRTQVEPKIRPLILPDFYWDFGAKSPRGPGKNAAIFSNCDRLEIFVGGKSVATAQPDRTNFSRLKYPPFFCDLDIDGASHPELRVDGYVGDTLAVSKSFSADASQDQFYFAADDAEIVGDGSDATRLVFKVTDKFGAERAFAGGQVAFDVTGRGILVGDNPFGLADSGGVGAIWVKTEPGANGKITVAATHSLLGKKSVEINIKYIKS